MAYILTKITPPARTTVRSFASREAALAYVEAVASYYEEDPDNPGFYDLFTKGGDILALEPAAASA
jgi:hypothetical protein